MDGQTVYKRVIHSSSCRLKHARTSAVEGFTKLQGKSVLFMRGATEQAMIRDPLQQGSMNGKEFCFNFVEKKRSCEQRVLDKPRCAKPWLFPFCLTVVA